MDFLRFLEGLRTPLLDKLFFAITELGGESLFLALGVLMFWCVNKQKGYLLLSVGFFGTEINQTLKLLFRIPRPWVLDPSFTIVESARAGATGYSFPSGHTQNIVGTTAVLVRKEKSRWVRILSYAAMILVPFSRMYLGVHTPKDVFTSVLIALLLAAVLGPLFDRSKERPGILYGIFAAMIGLSAAVLFYVLSLEGEELDYGNWDSGVKTAYTLLGAVLGMTAAMAADQKAPFAVEAPLLGQVGKMAVGLALVFAIRLGLKAPLMALFPTGHLADGIRYFLMVIFAGVIWPRTFPFWQKIGKKAGRSVTKN